MNGTKKKKKKRTKCNLKFYFKLTFVPQQLNKYTIIK